MDSFKNVVDYSNAAKAILERPKALTGHTTFGQALTVRAHLDTETGDLVIGVFNQRGRFHRGLSTMEPK